MRISKWIVVGLLILLVLTNIQGVLLGFQVQRLQNYEEELEMVMQAVINSKEILKVTQDALQAPTGYNLIGRDLADFFLAIYAKGGLGYKEDVKNIWTASGITCAGDRSDACILSRLVAKYPTVGWYWVLPNLTTWGTNSLAIGPCVDTATDLWKCMLAEYDGTFKIIAGTDPHMGIVLVTDLMPADYDTVRYEYHIKVERDRVSFWIGAHLKATILLGCQEDIPVWENNEPYALASTVAPLPYSRHPLFIILNAYESGTPATWDIPEPTAHGEARITFAEGQASSPMMLAIYTENTATKWAGLTTAGSLITSHPVPVWGYSRKTLLFQADAAGTLTVQVYAGGAWRDIATPTVVAGTLLQYDLTAETPIARCTYEPANNDVIAVAEWSLS